MSNNKNLILAFALSALVLFGWQWFVAMPQMKAEQARQTALVHQEKAKSPTAAAPGANLGLPSGGEGHMSREAALAAEGGRVAIDTAMVDGSIALKGARRPSPQDLSRHPRSQEPGDRSSGAQEHRLSLLRGIRLGGRQTNQRAQ